MHKWTRTIIPLDSGYRVTVFIDGEKWDWTITQTVWGARRFSAKSRRWHEKLQKRKAKRKTLDEPF